MLTLHLFDVFGETLPFLVLTSEARRRLIHMLILSLLLIVLNANGFVFGVLDWHAEVVLSDLDVARLHGWTDDGRLAV